MPLLSPPALAAVLAYIASQFIGIADGVLASQVDWVRVSAAIALPLELPAI